MISTVNLSVQFGEKPLFENVSIKFSSGNRYGLIGANGWEINIYENFKWGTGSIIW